MKIRVLSLVGGAKRATDLAVIIDVFRAATTIPLLLKQGAKEIIPVKDLEEAEKYKSKNYILIGEAKNGFHHKMFDFNNSPSEIYDKDFTGKTLVFRSNNATQAILNADKAREIILASFVNLQAVVSYIRAHVMDGITLIALGRLGKRGLEDDLCAEAIKYKLEDREFNFEQISERIRECDCAKLIRDKLKKPQDINFALQLNSCPIVPKVYSYDNINVIRPA